MPWFDLMTITFSIVTIVLVLYQTREIKALLADARYERMDINRRLEKVGQRLDRMDGHEEE